jgi:carbon-monoxide dehydrogenase small subunit
MKIKFRLNGRETQLDVTGAERLIDILRERLGLVGTKEGCGKGECGACTILADGKAICSCLILSCQINDKEILTIEGLTKNDHLHPIQKAFADVGAVQCGYCSPGMILSAAALLMKNPKPSKLEIKRALSGNLCRCTGYEKIVQAVGLASQNSMKELKRNA